jgi:DnaK suppressor protein
MWAVIVVDGVGGVGGVGVEYWSEVEWLMDENFVGARRAELMRLREELLATADSAAEGARPVDLEEPIGRISRVDAMQQQKMVAVNRQAAQQRRHLVEGALSRIEAGEYGECLGCGEEIDPRRLEAQPEAPFCIECQGRREQGG